MCIDLIHVYRVHYGGGARSHVHRPQVILDWPNPFFSKSIYIYIYIHIYRVHDGGGALYKALLIPVYIDIHIYIHIYLYNI